MGRPRTFDEEDVIVRAAAVFSRLGYSACSIEDLVEATRLQRGSLYMAFDSKRGLFEKVLQRALVAGWDKDSVALDLMITALRELASFDLPIAALCRTALSSRGDDAAELLGSRLLQHLPKKN